MEIFHKYGDESYYQLKKEAFVSNHGGTTPGEILHVIMPNLCSVLLTSTVFRLYEKYLHKNIRVVLEFVLIVIPTILSCTILSDHASIICLIMTVLSLINITLLRIRISRVSTLTTCILGPVCRKRPFLTNFRALSNITTAICILAVDFQIFPRKFAKTEVFGYSLMDAGVGIFIVANALVAPEAKDFGDKQRIDFFGTLLKSITKSARSAIPLLVLGFGRLFLIEFAGYHKHVSEYGVHWNFFITLSFVKLFTGTITSTMTSKYSLLSGIWILAMHEYILNSSGLKEWILSDEPRVDFITANREGLLSIPGYVGLYLVGVALGRLIHSTYLNLNSNTMLHSKRNIYLRLFNHNLVINYNESIVLCAQLFLIAVYCYAVALLCNSYFRASRRLANAGYCSWILALSAILLTLSLIVEMITDVLIYATTDYKSVDYKSNEITMEVISKAKQKKHKTTSKYEKVHRSDVRYDKENLPVEGQNSIKRTLEICEAVNYNGLLFFLSSNVTTGIINLFVSTLHVEQYVAVQILIGHMIINMLLVVTLYRYGVQIKL